MGDTGPCGPCSEIHVDIRSDEERKKIPGRELVNHDHPHVIEIWNLVFIQYNRKADGSLENLPSVHVDTGMGFERLCMVMQGTKSNYDTDVFQPIIQKIAVLANIKYGSNLESDIAMRVIADHLRAISFAIADGQLPSNNKAGYVIRRILRRAVRYGYTFLGFNEPFINKLVGTLVQNLGAAFPELKSQQQLIEKVIFEEEASFLRTLENGIRLLDQIMSKNKLAKNSIVNGANVFELYDTYGFPLDLTQLILKENGLTVNIDEFNAEMLQQKDRSRNAATATTEDWTIVKEDEKVEFVGYDKTDAELSIIRYRKITTKETEFYQLVFNATPFYAESGGQVGDKGYIEADGEKIQIVDTKKENNLIIHIVEQLPKNTKAKFKAVVNNNERTRTACNHTATHLLHEALREVLGNHVEQKGSLVNPDYLRFDFAHFQKLTDEEIEKVELIVNRKIRTNIQLNEKRNIPVNEAKEMGAMALFGEKYGDFVRVIKFASSIELCGGTHVKSTGEIGFFKIISESAIAAGIRRIEAISSVKAEEYINAELKTLREIKSRLKNSKDILKSIDNLFEENETLQKQIEEFGKEKAGLVKKQLHSKIQQINGINLIAEIIDISNPNDIKDIAYQLKGEIDNLFLVLGAKIDDKANLTVMISDNLVSTKNLNAGSIIREIAKEIQGGGGGQAFYATAGGKNPEGLIKAIEKAKSFV